MEMENSYGLMVEYIKVNIKMIKSKVKVNFIGPMEANIMVNG